ncbi:MAG: hypothetical protein HYX80_03400 [Chloroflexi bacterium]|nr:hypothetical protein [Chloroflexota bacterium]
MPYVAKLEEAGVPTVMIDFEDQESMIHHTGLQLGFPNTRVVHASRTIPGPEDVENWVEEVLAGLTTPLTAKEKESGRFAPPQDRIIFEGTLDEAQVFFQQTRDVPVPVNAPICVYSDGLPIVAPTEEKVKEMLTGTSHKPDELITYQRDIQPMMVAPLGGVAQQGRGGGMGMIRKKGEVVSFHPNEWTATVEKVATIAVMAGCKPEHLPVVLAIAESGCRTGTTVMNSQAVCLSGPIVDEIKMNTGCGMFGPGSPANAPIGRAYQLMAINLSGAIPGVNRMSSLGSPINNGGTCFAERTASLPPGWKGLNEEFGFKKNESAVMVMGFEGGLSGRQFSPGGYRALQKSGHGGIARRLGVKGIPGPHNWLEYYVHSLWEGREGAVTLVMVSEMAKHLHDYGFKTKDEVYEWLWKASFKPLSEYRNRSWVDLTTNGWMGIEALSGKHWKELPDDYKLPFAGNNPGMNCIIVASSEEEICLNLEGGRGTAYSVDAWR